MGGGGGGRGAAVGGRREWPLSSEATDQPAQPGLSGEGRELSQTKTPHLARVNAYTEAALVPVTRQGGGWYDGVRRTAHARVVVVPDDPETEGKVDT